MSLPTIALPKLSCISEVTSRHVALDRERIPWGDNGAVKHRRNEKMQQQDRADSKNRPSREINREILHDSFARPRQMAQIVGHNGSENKNEADPPP